MFKIFLFSLLLTFSTEAYAQWVEINDDWNFSFSIPEFYSFTTDTVTTDTDFIISKNYISKIDQDKYQFSATSFSNDYLSENKNNILSDRPKSLARVIKGEVLSTERITLNGFDGVLFEVANDKAFEYHKMIVTDNVMYHLSIKKNEQNSFSDAQLTTFFNSLDL